MRALTRVVYTAIYLAWLGMATVFTGLMAPSASADGLAAPQTVLPNQTPKDLVNAFHTAFGDHHARAVHAKGIILEGQFTPDKDAVTLTKAPMFAGASLPATVRFSDFTGIPDIPDNIGDASPRGLAVKIKAKNDETFDMVMHSFNGFPVSTSDEMAALLRSIGASGHDVPHPTPLDQFLASHPAAKQFLTTQKPPPVSYATTPFFGVNALKYTNAAGKSVFVRYQFVPRAGEHYLTLEQATAKGPNYLREEIIARVAKEPVVFDWYAQISAGADKIDDPSKAWPDSRRRVKLGTLTITAVQDDASADKQTLFLPGQAHVGIEAADPMLVLRNNAYPISFAERQ